MAGDGVPESNRAVVNDGCQRLTVRRERRSFDVALAADQRDTFAQLHVPKEEISVPLLFLEQNVPRPLAVRGQPYRAAIAGQLPALALLSGFRIPQYEIVIPREHTTAVQRETEAAAKTELAVELR